MIRIREMRGVRNACDHCEKPVSGVVTDRDLHLCAEHLEEAGYPVVALGTWRDLRKQRWGMV